jgi:hypothetical protein
VLRKIKFTFTVEPGQLALLLSHSGKLDIELMADEQPTKQASKALLALPAPKPKPKNRNVGLTSSSSGLASVMMKLITAAGPEGCNYAALQRAVVKAGYSAQSPSSYLTALVRDKVVRRIPVPGQKAGRFALIKQG